MRTFVAINLPADEREALHSATAAVREALPAASWTPAAKLHLTLKFVGEADDAMRARLVEALGEVARRSRPLDLGIGGMGVFPNPRAPRIVWMSVEPAPRLELLHHDVEKACEEVGIPGEGRPFHPHITIGRVKTPPPVETRRAMVAAMRDVRHVARVPVMAMDLMGSTLAPDGARHELLQRFPLGSEG